MDVVFKEQIEGERQGCCENPSVLPFVRVEEGPGGAEQDYDHLLAFQSKANRSYLCQKLFQLTQKQKEEGLWFLSIPTGGQCK